MKRPAGTKPAVSGTSGSIEEAVFQVLLAKGQIIPESEEEVRAAEERLTEEGVPLPPELEDPKQALERVKRHREERERKVVPLFPKKTESVEFDFACVARKGTEIPPELWERMRRDRKQAEGKLDGQSERT